MRLTPLLLLAACATYAPRPLAPPSPRDWNARRLDDPALRSSLDSAGVSTAPAAWDDWALAQAAWLVRPERPRLAAQLAAADATRITAGARVPPGVTTETEYSFSGSGGESRWGVALAATLTLELGGKRGARLARAEAERLRVLARGEGEAWDVRWAVREAALRKNQADRLLAALNRERDLLDSLRAYSRQRYADGALGRLEVARVEAERDALAAEIAGRTRDAADAEASLAVVAGFPVSELRRLDPPAASGATCHEGATRDSLQLIALDRRWPLREAIAAYQVAEAELRVEVSRSWPDLAIGPGLFFDHGIKKWTILLGLPALPFNRNRGPIAEADARRTVAARTVTEAQEQVLGEVEQALAMCEAAAAERAAYDTTAGRARLVVADSAWARGEIGRLDLILVRLEVARAERRLTEAAAHGASAALALEQALGVWQRAIPETTR